MSELKTERILNDFPLNMDEEYERINQPFIDEFKRGKNLKLGAFRASRFSPDDIEHDDNRL